VLPAHDWRDAPNLLQQAAPKILVADKAYDVEEFHEFADELGIRTMIPIRRGTRRGFFRKKMQKTFRLRTYHRREIVEALFGAIKRTLGSAVSCRKAKTIKAELYCRLLTFNLFSVFIDF
jgi:transposase